MVIGLLALAAIPTTIGVAEGVSQQRQQNSADDDDDDAARLAKFNIDVSCQAQSRRAKEVQGKRVVLREGKVYIDTPPRTRTKTKTEKDSYPAQAFYIDYPDDERERTRGLVTKISDDPPMLNWMYVDKDTLEVRYGNRTQSRAHHVGPWDWTEDDDQGGVTFEGWEGFVAVEEEAEEGEGGEAGKGKGKGQGKGGAGAGGEWALYFDRNDDGLRGVVDRRKKKMLEVNLERVMCKEE